MPLGASAHSAFRVTIPEEALARQKGASARQCLVVSQADDDIAPGSIHTAIVAGHHPPMPLAAPGSWCYGHALAAACADRP
jgi:hypothetical protein